MMKIHGKHIDIVLSETEKEIEVYMGEWVFVDDKLPAEAMTVIIAFPFRGGYPFNQWVKTEVTTGYFVEIGGEPIWKTDKGDIKVDVFAWMPLPPPPQKQK